MTPGPAEHPTELIQEALQIAARGDFQRALRGLTQACRYGRPEQVDRLRAALDPFRVDRAGWIVAGVTAAALAVIIGINLFP